MSKFIYQPKIISQTPSNQISKNKKRASSQIKYQKAPDIMTQAKPSFLNNFVQQINPHKSAFTPTNRSKNMSQQNLLLPQKTSEFSNKKTLILDLDETLVHSSFAPFEKNDIILNVDFESVMYNIYVLVRPGAETFIKKVSELFEVIIFTASIAKYALPLLDILDNEKKIQYRLTREHCTYLNAIYIKELKRLNRNLKDVIIVDNSPLAYAFDSSNGLPITTWYDDKGDTELEKIFPLLEFLSKTNDVRTYINKFVNNNVIQYELVNEYIKNEKEKDKILNINTNNKQNGNIIKCNNNNNNNNKENANAKKAISVNINLDNKNNINNFKELKNNFDNNKENKIINKNENKAEVDSPNNNINKTSNNIIIKKFFNEKYYDSNNTNNMTNTNTNINKKNSKNKNTTFIKNKKGNNDKIANSKSNIIMQKKKNSFRIGQKLGEKLNNKKTAFTNNIHLKNNANKFCMNNTKSTINNCNSDIDSNFPLGLTLSNTTKNNNVSEKAQLQYNYKNLNNFNQDSTKRMDSKNKTKVQLIQNKIFHEKNNNINYNYNYNNSVSKKYKYTNLLEKLENKTIKSKCTLNNKSQIKSKSTKINNGKITLKKNKYNSNNKKTNHLRISSSLIGKYQALIRNNSTTDNKTITSAHVLRSKSTGNFINYTRQFQNAKTPKSEFVFEKNIKVRVSRDNSSKINKRGTNLINSRFSNTTRHLNNNHLINFSNKSKNKNV